MSGPPSRRAGSGHHCATSGGRGMRPGRRAVRRPFGGLPACIECHPVCDRGSFKDVPCFGRNRRHYVASSPVPDYRDAGAWRPPPFQRNNETDRRIETVLGALCRHGEANLLAGPMRQRHDAQRTGTAPDSPADQAPVVPRKGLLGRRIVVSRPPALQDLGLQRGQGKRREDFNQVQSVRGRARHRRVLGRAETFQEPPDRRVGAEHCLLAAVGRLNAAAELRDETPSDSVNGS